MIKEDVNRTVKICILFFLTPFSHHSSDLTTSSHVLKNLTGFSQPVKLFPHHSHSKKAILQVQKEKEENQMTEKLEDRCKRLIVQHEYKECEKKLGEAMLQNPHSAIPHNLMGILMEKRTTMFLQ